MNEVKSQTSIYSDKKLMAASVIVLLLFLAGLLKNQIAGEDGLIPFDPQEIAESSKAFSKPGTVLHNSEEGSSRTHLLGSDQFGRDVAARLIHGTGIALQVGLISSLISLIIALILGGLSGYYGDHKHRINFAQLVGFFLFMVIVHHTAHESAYFVDKTDSLKWSIGCYFLVSLGGWLLMSLTLKLLSYAPIRQLTVRWDTIVMKTLEIFRSIPRLFLLLAFFAIIAQPTVSAVIIIIGLIRWPTLTRLIRAEVLKTKQETYVANAQLLGMSDLMIYIKHILPNIYQPILILTALNIGTAILIESSLSFLHIGLPLSEVSWGRMLGDARQYFPAWWMALGPGLLIFLSILAFNTLADRLNYHLKSR